MAETFIQPYVLGRLDAPGAIYFLQPDESFTRQMSRSLRLVRVMFIINRQLLVSPESFCCIPQKLFPIRI